MENTSSPYSGEKPEQKFNTVANSMEKAANRVADKAADIGSKIADGAQQFGSDMSDRADETITSVGKGITGLAGKIRKNSPHDGTFGAAADAVAGRLESSGKYLTDTTLSEIENDMTSVVRRNPIQSMCVGIGLGVLIGNLFSRK